MALDLWESAKQTAEYCKEGKRKREEELAKMFPPKTEQEQKAELDRYYREHYGKPYKKENPFWGSKVEATIIWIAVMIFGSIFYDRVWIWIVTTVIWLDYMTKDRKKK